MSDGMIGAVRGEIRIDVGPAMRALKQLETTFSGLDKITLGPGIDRALDGIRQTVEGLERQFRGLDRVNVGDNLSRQLNDVSDSADRASRSFGGLGSAISVAAGIGIAGAFDAIGDSISTVAGSVISFDQNMANVNSIAGLSSTELANLNSQVLALASNPGITDTPAQLADGLYNIVSSGFSATEALGVLGVAATAATAGMTDTETSGRAISAVLNAYGLDATHAQEVSDYLFQTVNSGVITFEELANNMGNVLPVASQLGVGIDEVGAAYASLTLQGIGASEAETGVASIMRSALNPTEALTAATQAAGYASAEAAIQALGLSGYMELLESASGGTAEGMTNLLGTADGTGAALALLSDDGAGLVDTYADMEGATEGLGATQTALAAQMEGAGFKIAKAKQSMLVLATTLGGALLPIVGAVADALTQFVGILTSVGKYFKFVASDGDTLNDFLADVPGPLRGIVKGFGEVIAGIRDFVDRFKAVWDGITAPITAVSDAMAGFADATSAIASPFDTVSTALSDFGDAARAIADPVGATGDALAGFADAAGGVGTSIQGVTRFLNSLSMAIRSIGGDNTPPFLVNLAAWIDRITPQVQAFVDGVQEAFGYLSDVFTNRNAEAGLERFDGALRPVMHGLGKLVDTAADFIAAFSEGGVLGVIRAIPDELGDLAAGFGLIAQGIGQALLDGVRNIDWSVVGGAVLSGLGTAFETVSTGLAASLRAFGGSLVEAFPVLDVFEPIAGAITGVTDAVGGLIAKSAGIAAVGAMIGRAGATATPIFARLAGVFTTLLPRLGLLAVRFLGLTSPIGLIINAGLLLYTAYRKNFLGFATGVDKVVDMVQAGFTRLVGFLGPIVGRIGDIIGRVGDGIASAFGPIVDGGRDVIKSVTGIAKAIQTRFRAVSAVAGTFGGVVAALLLGFKQFGALFRDIGDRAGDFISGLAERFPALGRTLDAIGAQVQRFGELFGDAFDLIARLIDGDLSGAFGKLGEIVSDVFALIVGQFQTLGSILLDAFDAINWGTVGSTLLTGFGMAWDGITALGASLWGWIADSVSAIDFGAIGGAIMDGVRAALGAVADLGAWTLNVGLPALGGKVLDFAGDLWGWVKEGAAWLADVLDPILPDWDISIPVPGVIGDIVDTITDIWGWVQSKVGWLASVLGPALPDWDISIPVPGVIGDVITAVTNAWDWLQSKVGWLASLFGWGSGGGESGVSGDGIPTAPDFDVPVPMPGISGAISEFVGGAWDWIQDKVPWLSDAWDCVVDAFNLSVPMPDSIGEIMEYVGDMCTWVKSRVAWLADAISFDLSSFTISSDIPEIGGKIKDAFTDMMGWVKSAVSWLSEPDAITHALTSFVISSGIPDIAGDILTFAGTAWDWVKSKVAWLKDEITADVTLTINAIGGAVNAAAGFVADVWNGIGDLLGWLWDGATGFTTNAGVELTTTVSSAGSSSGGGARGFGEATDDVDLSAIPSAIEIAALATAYTTAQTTIQTAVQGIMGDIVAMKNQIVQDVVFAADETAAAWGNWVKGVPGTVRFGIQQIMGDVSNMKLGVTSDTTDAANTTAETWGDWIGNVPAMVAIGMTNIMDAVSRMKEGVVRDIQDAVDTTLGHFNRFNRDGTQAIDDAATTIASSAYNVGSMVSLGVSNGMDDFLYRVTNSVNAIVSEVDRGLRAGLKVASPSKLTGYYGQMSTEGFANGLTSRLGMVTDAINKVVGAVTRELQSLGGVRDIAAQVNKGWNNGDNDVLDLNGPGWRTAAGTYNPTATNLLDSMRLIADSFERVLSEGEYSGDELTHLPSKVLAELTRQVGKALAPFEGNASVIESAFSALKNLIGTGTDGGLFARLPDAVKAGLVQLAAGLRDQFGIGANGSSANKGTSGFGVANDPAYARLDDFGKSLMATASRLQDRFEDSDFTRTSIMPMLRTIEGIFDRKGFNSSILEDGSLILDAGKYFGSSLATASLPISPVQPTVGRGGGNTIINNHYSMTAHNQIEPGSAERLMRVMTTVEELPNAVDLVFGGGSSY